MPAGAHRARTGSPGAVGGAQRRLRPHPRRHRRRCARLHRLQRPGPPARRLPTPAPAARLPRVPHHHRQGQLRNRSAGVGPGAAGATRAADAAQPRSVQHHDLRPRRPLPRREGRPSGDLRQPRRHRSAGTDRRCPRQSDLRITDAAGDLEERRAKDFPSCLLDARGQRGRLLPRDQPAGPPGPHRNRVQHPGVEGDRHSTGSSQTDGQGDRTPQGQSPQRPHMWSPAPRRWPSRSPWRSGSMAPPSPSRCARPARTSNWHKGFCSPRASSATATTSPASSTAAGPARTAPTRTTCST